MCTGVVGPSLIELQLQVAVDVDTIAFILTCCSAGYITGSIVGGICFDRFENQLLLCGSTLCMAVFAFVIPWCNHFASLIVMSGLLGISEGFLDTGKKHSSS